MEFPKIDEVYKLLSEKLESWVEGGITLLPNIVVAFFIAIAFGIFAKVIGNVAGKIMRRTFESRQIASLLTSIIKSIVLIAGIFIALDFVGLKGTVTSLLAGAGIVGLAIGFAFQDMTENFIAGVAMGIRKPFEIGDVIEAEGVFGNVKEINLRNTLVETFYGQLEVIPNKILFRNILTNYSYLGYRRIEVPVGISYADDIEEAAKVITDAMNEKDYVIKKRRDRGIRRVFWRFKYQPITVVLDSISRRAWIYGRTPRRDQYGKNGIRRKRYSYSFPYQNIGFQC